MPSDLDADKGSEPEPKKGSAQILKEEIVEGRTAMERPVRILFISGLSAGLDIGFSLLLMAVMKTRAEGHLPRPVVEMLVAAMYAVGFIFVVLGRSELFTEQTTLAVLPVLNRKASVAGLARIWIVIYVANLLGAAAIAAIIAVIAPALGVAEPIVFAQIAKTLAAPAGWVILVSAILASWLMGLLSWLVTAARDTISQIVIVGIIATVIGFAGLHHVIVGTVEVLGGIFAGGDVTWGDFGHFLFWTTLGNALGGPFFVAFIKSGFAGDDLDGKGSRILTS